MFNQTEKHSFFPLNSEDLKIHIHGLKLFHNNEKPLVIIHYI